MSFVQLYVYTVFVFVVVVSVNGQIVKRVCNVGFSLVLLCVILVLLKYLYLKVICWIFRQY